MFRKSKKEFESQKEFQAWRAFEKEFKSIRKPKDAVRLLQEAIDLLGSMDKQSLGHFILYLRQIAEDLQFKYYKARCPAILIPPEDSLTFTVCYVLGNLPEMSRFSEFEGKVQELLKILAQAQTEKQRGFGKASLPQKEVATILSLIKGKYPVFYTGITQEPVLIPVFDFPAASGSILSLPHLHCFGLFRAKNEDKPFLVSILHSFIHILHYRLTEDLQVLPPGFVNLYARLFDDHEFLDQDWSEVFADLVVASLFYGTEYMPLVAYMELCYKEQEEISKYLSWLEMIFAASLQENIRRLILKSEGRLRA